MRVFCGKREGGRRGILIEGNLMKTYCRKEEKLWLIVRLFLQSAGYQKGEEEKELCDPCGDMTLDKSAED